MVPVSLQEREIIIYQENKECNCLIGILFSKEGSLGDPNALNINFCHFIMLLGTIQTTKYYI